MTTTTTTMTTTTNATQPAPLLYYIKFTLVVMQSRRLARGGFMVVWIGGDWLWGGGV